MQPTTSQPGGADGPDQPQGVYRPEQPEQPAPYIPPHIQNPQPVVLPQPVVPRGAVAGPLAGPVVGTGGSPHTAAASPAPTNPQQPQPAGAAPETVAWEASEYLQRNKDTTWIVLFGLATLVFLGLAVWSQSWTFVAMVIAAAGAIGFYAFRKPRVLQYAIDHDGVSVGDHDYEFTDFRAFGVHEEEAFYSALLIPVKRLMPAVRMYFSDEDGENIVDILSEHLPMEDLPPDPYENFMRRLHF